MPAGNYRRAISRTALAEQRGQCALPGGGQFVQRNVELTVYLQGITGHGADVRAEAAVESGAAKVELAVPEPMRWWPAGYGDQPLYDLTVIAKNKDGSVEVLELTDPGSGVGGFSYYDHLCAAEGCKDLEWMHEGRRFRSQLVFRMNGARRTEAFLQEWKDGRWVPVVMPDGCSFRRAQKSPKNGNLVIDSDGHASAWKNSR